MRTVGKGALEVDHGSLSEVVFDPRATTNERDVDKYSTRLHRDRVAWAARTIVLGSPVCAMAFEDNVLVASCIDGSVHILAFKPLHAIDYADDDDSGQGRFPWHLVTT